MTDDLKELLTTLSNTPNEVASLVKDVPLQSLIVRPSPHEFSLLENVCHLRDIEIEGYTVRIRRILNEDEPQLADVDGARLAIERDYNRENLNEALAAFTAARQQNLSILNETEGQFERTGVMEGLGKITLRKLLEMMTEHDGGHLDEISRNVRLLRSQPMKSKRPHVL